MRFLILAMFTTSAMANQELVNLLADDLRFKSCQISLKYDGYAKDYEILVDRDCPSGQCSIRLLGGYIKVNSKETKSGLKTVKNSLAITYDGAIASLEVVEFHEWRGSFSIPSPWSVFGGSGPSWQVGVIKKVLKMQIDVTSGEVKELEAYRKAYRKAGIIGTPRNLLLSHRKKKWVDCQSPAPGLRDTLASVLWERAPINEWPMTPVRLTDSEKADLEETLLGLMPSENTDDYTQTLGRFRGPLHYAAYHGLTNFARQLIYILVGLGNYRALNQKDSFGETPLYHAVAQGQLAMVELLLATKGIDVAISGREGTPKELALLRVKENCPADKSCAVAKKTAALC